MTTTASRADASESHPHLPNGDSTSAELNESLRLIESVAAAKDQLDAVSELVATLGKLFPGATVRCGLGGNRLHRLYDAKLGWLGPASDWFQQLNENWNDDSGVPIRESHLPEPHQPTLRLNVDDSIGGGRCLLLLHGPSISERDRLWLRRCLPTLRLLLWQRPADPVTRIGRWLARRGTNTRVYVGLAVMCAALILMWPVPYRIRCSAIVRPAESRVVAAPFAATLAQTHVILGDTVKAGDPVVTLDGRPLRLELETISAQIGQLQKERDIAMAGRRVAERQQAELKIRELSRQRDLHLERLNKLVVTSPIDGVIVSGDLRRSIGAPLEIGQAMIEVAPLDRMSVEIEIPEYEIGYVTQTSKARMRFTASSRRFIDQPIDQLYPSAEVRDNQNVFIARVDVENSQGDIRPGMRGDAVTYGPLRPWLWSITRGVVEKIMWWVGC